MPCACSTQKDKPTDYSQLPDRPCDLCGEKHFSAALALAEERGYTPVNRQRIIGELVAAQWHIYEKHPVTAEKIRSIRHTIQARKKVYESDWESVCRDFEEILKFKVEEHLCDGEIFHDFTGRVFVISNCPYTRADRLTGLTEGDLLVFINKAKSASFYSGRKVVFHRSPEEAYGTDTDKSSQHFYAFSAGKNVPAIPGDFIKNLKSSYDFDYPIEEGKTKSMTTGYMVTQFLAHVLPQAEITLVNFGFDVPKSSYRCPWHNWIFENKELKTFHHIFTQKGETTCKK
ncbi:MAG: hypothetical protein IKD01_01655 [Oscillospiraceae bacterium]|nr:hypothetical protein [Oscillospiraceae bacterium]